MRWPDSLRWPGLRPETRGAVTAAVVSGVVLAGTTAVALNMIRLSGNTALGAASLVAFLYSLHLLVLTVVLAGLAWFAWWKRARLAGALLVATAVVVTAMAILPVNAQWARARDYDVTLSVGEYISPSHGDGRFIGREALTTADGAEIAVEVWGPATEPAAGTAARPAIVLVHGGSWIEGAPGGMPEWNRLLPDLGFVVFDIAYRLPSQVPAGWRPELEVGDVKCAIGSVRERADEVGIDPERVSVMGHSAGGTLALLAAYSAGDAALPPTCDVPDTPVRSVVNVYGPPDLARLWRDTGTPTATRDVLTQYLLGGLDQIPATYALLSPSTHVSAAAPPSISIIGEQDQIVPPDDVRELGRLLEGAGVEHEEWYLPGADHIFDASWGAFSTQIARAKVTEFLRAHG